MSYRDVEEREELPDDHRDEVNPESRDIPQAEEEDDEDVVYDPEAPVLDPQTATADDLVDEETRESYNNILATQDFIARSEEDQRILRLQQAEITDLLERAGELGKNEYFDVSYFTSETRKVWREREAQDRRPEDEIERPNAVRLFPSEAEARHQERLRDKLREDHALEDREELQKRHPLLFNRVVRDESRRAVFSSAMEARRSYVNRLETPSTMPLLLQHEYAASNHSLLPPVSGVQQPKQPALTTAAASHDRSGKIVSCASTSLNATVGGQRERRPFASLPDYISESVRAAMAETQASESSRQSSPARLGADVAAHLAAAEAIVNMATADGGDALKKEAAPLSLTEMLSQQRHQLRDLQRREEDTYRPLLASYFAYDEAVRAKLDKLLATPL